MKFIGRTWKIVTAVCPAVAAIVAILCFWNSGAQAAALQESAVYVETRQAA